MKLIVFGGTGMVGMGALREALADPAVDQVLAVGRRSTGVTHTKLEELLLPDLFDFAGVESKLAGYDGCIWAIGVSSVGMNETDYARMTEELTLLWAKALLRLNPRFSFAYVSGQGADRDIMWARVRRRLELALEALPFSHVACVRPGFIRPGPGISSRVRLYQFFIVAFRPLFPLVMWLAPSKVTTSEQLGRALVRITQGRADRFILDPADINRLGS
jgi:uncharacterized protein YbjT (DUF2867 family)